MNRAITLLLDEGGFDRARVVSEVGLFASDIERLCGLPENYLRASNNKVVPLRLRSPQESIAQENGNAQAQVVDMASRRKS